MAILILLPLALGLTLPACGRDDGDPTQVVRDLFQAMVDKQFARIPDFACAAQKAQVRETFDLSANIAGALGDADADPQMVLDMLTFAVSGMEVTEVSKSRDRATVHMKGHLELTVVPEEFYEVVRVVLQEQGFVDVSDALIQQVAASALEQLEDFDIDFDDDLLVVKEDGQWVICGE